LEEAIEAKEAAEKFGTQQERQRLKKPILF
jgi:hypothetical protein